MNTKDWILENTLKLILDKKTIDISISEIRNATGLTTGGIYYYFSDKNDILDAVVQKYLVEYIKIDFNKIILEGSSRDRIHDALFYMLHHFMNGVEIESINEKIHYRDVIFLLTATGNASDDVNSMVSQTVKDIEKFITDLVEEGIRRNEIRHDFSVENIAESLYLMYFGVQNYWLIFPNDDIDNIFEKNFDLTWQAIRYR